MARGAAVGGAHVEDAAATHGAGVDREARVEDAAVTLGAGIVLGARVTGACRWREVLV